MVSISSIHKQWGYAFGNGMRTTETSNSLNSINDLTGSGLRSPEAAVTGSYHPTHNTIYLEWWTYQPLDPIVYVNHYLKV